MSERGFSMRRDGVGIVLFTAGAFFAVLLLKALASDLPAGEAVGTAALAQLWIDGLGFTASLLFTAGIAAIGARMFLTDTAARTAAAAGLLAIVAIAVATIAGSFSASAGGRIGDAIGGSVGRVLHPAVGVLLGLALLALPFAGALRRRLEVSGEAPLVAGDATENEIDGVTAAEAAALLPDDRHQATLEARKQPRTSTWAPPPSPYPEDVRRRGEIPAGAKPLEPVHVATADPVESPALHRWTAPRTETPADAARDDVAVVRDDELAEPAFAAAASVELDRVESDVVERLVTAADLDDADDAGELAVVELRASGVTRATEADDDADDDADLLAAAEYLITPAPSVAVPLDAAPVPSWEQSSLFVEEEEPVDAYGTPLTLVDAIRDEVTPEAVAEVAGLVEAAQPLDVDLDDLDEDEDEDGELDEDDDGEWDEDEDDAEETDEYEVVAEEVEEEPATHAAAPILAAPTTVAAVAAAVAATETEAAGEPDLNDVVLTPIATADADRREMLSAAGCLFVERGRVAVSMLQREFGMDFDAACTVLDDLQNLGLIGPYLGGQRRDILLTREQWLEKVESA
ncbi:MAG: DNA translocase FtsK [Planctomycetota bacterium]